ncbi:mucin-17 isoform X2 [Harpegnathos saltator]|uniref:mucin-17 isoform X2 n=1 Tax=Harpegnathos saltator TaxID=610380 RepID=UPI000DBEE830|nr:mucin-17 isoform X2 [Harpegnathos saltator]
MPYYNDVPYYYGASYANHSSLMTGTGRPFAPLSRFSPHLSTISESPLNHLHRFSSISVSRHPRRVIDTADIDVSSPRVLSHDGTRARNRLRRDRPTIKIRSQALKDNPALREHHERHEKSVGELLMEKFLIKDKKSADDNQQQPVRLYHQISLESELEGGGQDREALQKRITRRFTRRRSSTDLQLDPEQLQREAAYAQVQAKVLDSLVAEEQAQIESEARRGTLIRKGTVVRGSVNGHSNYYSDNFADSDTMTREEEEEMALRMRKNAKKAKKKKKSIDKPSPPDRTIANDHVLDNRRSSASSELSVDSKVDEVDEAPLEENGPRPQMYKIEASNSAGDFSSIWVNTSEKEPQRKMSVEQFRESVRVPIPRKLGVDVTAAPKSADDAEMRVVLPVRKPYVMDPSRNSVYLTMKKPEKARDETLDEELGRMLETEVNGVQPLANGFVDASADRILEDDVSKSSMRDEESLKLKDLARAPGKVKDAAVKKTAGRLKRSDEPSTKKKDARATPKSLDDDDDDDSRVKRDTVISKTTKDDEVRESASKGEPPKSTEVTTASASSVESGASTVASTSVRAKQLGSPKDPADVKTKKDNENTKIDAAKSSETVAAAKTKTPEAVASPKDALDANLKKHDENRKDRRTSGVAKKTKTSEDALTLPKDVSGATKKNNEIRKNEMTKKRTKSPEGLAAPRTDKLAEEKAHVVSDTPKIPAMSHQDATPTTTARRSVVTNAGDTRENIASIVTVPTPSATGLPKASKINADRNNTVEAPELSLREDEEEEVAAAAHLADESVANKSEREEDALPGKKTDKTNLATRDVPEAPTRKANGVDKAGDLARDDVAAKSKSDGAGATLPEGANDQVRSNERDEIATAEDVVRSTSDTGLTKTTKYKAASAASRELPPETARPSAKSEAEAAVTGAPSDASLESEDAKPLKIDAKKISAVVDAEKDASRDSGVSSPKGGKVSKLGGAESKFPFKVKTFQKTVASDVGKDPSAPKAAKNDDGKAPTTAKRDANAPRNLKKSTSVDSSKSTADFPSSDANVLPKTLQQSVSVDEKAADKRKPVKKTLEPAKFPSKLPQKQPATSLDVKCEKLSQAEPAGQLSKSASVESIDFWSEIKAPDSPRASDSKKKKKKQQQQQQQGAVPSGPDANALSPKIAEKADPISGPKWVSSDSPARGKPSTAAAIKEPDEKKNGSDVKISVATGATPAVAADDVAEERRPKERAAEAGPRPRTEVEKKSAQQQAAKAPRAKKKTANLSIAIGAKDLNSTVKKAPVKAKREDTVPPSPPRPDSKATPTQGDAASLDTSSEGSTPVVAPAAGIMPAINIDEVPTVLNSSESADHEDYEEVSTPTNEPVDPTLTKISKWSNRNDLTNTDDAETPVVSEETSLATSPTASPQSSKTRRLVKKKKSSSKKKPSTKVVNDTTTSGQQSTQVAKPQLDKQLLAKPKSSPKVSPRSSPRNSPSQRPLDLIRMFYTTPSALLTATPRDLSKVRRVKIKRRKHHPSRTPSVSSDSTGSTTSTATTGSTDGSGSTCTELDDEVEQKRMNSTRSNDSGFDGSPRISTPSQSSDNQRNSDSSDHFSSGRITPPATNLPRFKKYAVTDFNFLKVLGKGSFGKVLLAELRGTECVYAVKCLKKDVVLEDDDVECTLIERKVLTLATRHPYLCHLFCTFQTDSHLFFVMEYLNGGDLMFHIQKSGRFPEARARFYAAEIWSGLNFLHKKGIVYRDLKLDNVLLDFDGHIRIADFGMCKLQIFLDRTADTFCGTPDYMAPEIIKGLKYNQAVDWWSYGVLLYEMLTGQSPFSGCDEDELFWSICNERPFIPRYLSQEATDILLCLLEKDSGKRPPGHEIAMHAFFQHLPWDRLERRQLEPPFKPALDHTLDTKYFDTAFTTERPRLTPVPEQILTSMDQGVFRGFSYTNPNATD